MIGLVVWLVSILAMASSVEAATFYVATTGSNGNSCSAAQSESTPKLTITAGVSCMTGGDTLIVKAGTYANQEILNPPAGSDSAYTVIMGDPSGARPILQPNAANFQRALYCSNGAACHHIELRYFEVDRPYEYAKLHGSETLGYAHHLKFINNVFHDSKASGLLILSSYRGFVGGDHLIQGNEFYNTGIGTPNYVPGFNVIYNPGSRSIVERNVFHDNSNGVGIWTASGANLDPHEIQNVIVRNNIFYRMGRTDLNAWSSGATMYSAVHVSVTGGGHQIYNNLIYDSGNTSVFLGMRVRQKGTQAMRDASAPILMFNNTFYNIIHSSAYAILILSDRGEGGPHVIANNIVYQAARGISASGQTVFGNLTTNPSFVNAGSGDFSLQSGSAAINAGTATAFSTHNGSAPDVGAFETVPNPTCSITTNKITCTFPMNKAVPIQIPSALGLTIGCTGANCPGGGLTAISASRKAGGTDSQVEIPVAGFAGDACVAANQAITLNYNSTTGGWTDYSNIGIAPGRHQKIFSFTNLAVTNLCDGSGPPPPPGGPLIAYNMDEGIDTTLTNTGSSGATDNGTVANGATWGTGHTGSGVVVNGGTQQVQIPYGLGVNPTTQSMTWVVAVNVPSGSTSVSRFDMGTSAGTNQRAYVGAQGTWKVAKQSTTLSNTAASNLTVDAGWNHLCVRWDSGTDTVTLYKNGVAGTGGATGSYTSFTLPTDLMLAISGDGFLASAPATYDDFQLFTSLEDCASLYDAWNPPPPPPPSGAQFGQPAYRFQAVYLPELGGSPTNFGTDINQPKTVVKGGAVAVVIEWFCENIADCVQDAPRLTVRQNGTGDWVQVPDMETDLHIWMWGQDINNLLNSGAITARLSAGSCTFTNGVTLLTSPQVPVVDLPQNGCTVLRYIVRIGATASGYYELQLAQQNGTPLAGTVVPARINVIDAQASAGP